jgi:hypothetical protein
MNTMLRETALWNDIIESDGKIHREETFLGAMLKTLVVVAALALLYWLISLV